MTRTRYPIDPHMTLSQYIERLHETMAADPDRRPGQTAFMVLWENRPDLADTINGTALDPFYSERALDDLLAWLAERLPG